MIQFEYNMMQTFNQKSTSSVRITLYLLEVFAFDKFLRLPRDYKRSNLVIGRIWNKVAARWAREGRDVSDRSGEYIQDTKEFLE